MKEYEDYSYPDEGLWRLKADIEAKADAYGFEIRVIGGLLKFTPKKAYTAVMLELEQSLYDGFIKIYKHRSSELTSKYKGRAVSRKWVVGFLEANYAAVKKHKSGKKLIVGQRGGFYIGYSGGRHSRDYLGGECCNACGRPIEFCICAG